MFQNNHQLILKLTRDCNLRCKYCYINDKDHYKGERLSFENFKKIIDKIIKEKRISEDFNKFDLVFHGGEPTLIGKKILRRMLEYSTKEFERFGMELSKSIQTNLTLIDEDFCKIFKDYNVGVGCSFDGFGISNSMRSKNSTDQFIEKLNLMMKNDVNFGYLTVVNKQNYKSAIKNTKKLQKKYSSSSRSKRDPKSEMTKVNIVENILVPEDDNVIEINGVDYFTHILKPNFDSFIKKQVVSESNSFEIIKRFIKDRLTHANTYFRSSCGSAFCGSGKTVMTLDPTGEVLLCGRYSDHFDEAKVGNVFKKDFLEIEQLSRIIKKTGSHNKVMNKLECDDCPALPICTTGCEAFYYSKFKEWGIREDIVCDVFKPAMKYLLDREEEVLKSYAKLNLIDQENNTNSSLLFIDRSKHFRKLKNNSTIMRVENDLNCKLGLENKIPFFKARRKR